MIIILIMASIVSAGVSWYQGENDYIDSIIIIATIRISIKKQKQKNQSRV